MQGLALLLADAVCVWAFELLDLYVQLFLSRISTTLWHMVVSFQATATVRVSASLLASVLDLSKCAIVVHPPAIFQRYREY